MLSIIIPTYNEEKRLPGLLKSIKKQKLKDYEVIVADNYSKDKTQQIAKKYGCMIVKGGNSPAKGRNLGAKPAKGDIFLFFDADVVLPEDMLSKSIEEFEKRNLDIATFFFRIKGSKFVDKILFLLGNIGLFFMQYMNPHAPGPFIICKKEIFEKIKGFDEKLKLAEDHDFVKRGSKVGKFRVLYKTLHFSMRRFEKEGRFKVLVKYAKCEIYRMTKGEIKTDLFNYEFGKF